MGGVVLLPLLVVLDQLEETCVVAHPLVHQPDELAGQLGRLHYLSVHAGSVLSFVPKYNVRVN